MGWLSDRVDAWRFKRTPLAQALRAHVQEYFYGEYALASFSQENKERLIGELTQKSSLIYSDTNPVSKAREFIAEYVLFTSPLLVAALTESEKAQHPIYSGQPAISGELYRHIRKIAEHVEELGRMIFEEDGIDDAELKAMANTRSAVGMFFANGFNIVRLELGDTADWYRPFMEATMVGDEDRLREKLGLPRLLSGPVDGLAYFNFFEYVLAGHANPFFAWKKDWPNLLLAGRGAEPQD